MAPKPQEDEVPSLDPTASNDKIKDHDEDSFLTQVEHLYEQDKVFQAATILRSLDPGTFEAKHHSMLSRAVEAEELVKDLKSDIDQGGWVDNGVSSGNFPTRILYRLEKGDKVELRARCETPIEKDLLGPLLSVLNETQLYETWLPSFTVPRFRVRECKKLKQSGRVSQIIRVIMDLPWPMSSRELVLSAAAFDAIDDDGQIGIKLKTIKTGDDQCVPEPDPQSVRVEIDGGFLFEACPRDHPCMECVEEDDVDAENMILVCFSAVMDPRMKLLPQSFLNFLVKTALGTAWKMLLKIAQDVKNGNRPDHANAIEEKKEVLYDYVMGRIEVMLSALSSAYAMQN